MSVSSGDEFMVRREKPVGGKKASEYFEHQPKKVSISFAMNKSPTVFDHFFNTKEGSGHL